MFSKIILSVFAAALVIGTASASYAAPKHQKVPEPLYFQYATGEEG
jgi:hypothetical protein